MLEKLYNDLANREYHDRVYKDEDKDFAAARKMEARQWLKSPSHFPMREKKNKVVQFVDDFYAAGAAKVFLADFEARTNRQGKSAENAMTMIVMLPKDPAARRKVFTVVWRAPREWMNDPDPDVGQKYLWYVFE